MKFVTKAHNMVIDYQQNFHKDWFIDVRARVVNAHTSDETSTHAFTTSVHGYMHRSF